MSSGGLAPSPEIGTTTLGVWNLNTPRHQYVRDSGRKGSKIWNRSSFGKISEICLIEYLVHQPEVSSYQSPNRV